MARKPGGTVADGSPLPCQVPSCEGVTAPYTGRQVPKWCDAHRHPRARQRATLGITAPRLNTRAPSSPVPADHPSRRRVPSAAQIAANEAAYRNGFAYIIDSGDRDGVIAHLRERVEVNEHGCWIWQRSLDREGYSKIRVGKRGWLSAHRVMAEAFYGEIPKGHPVHHRCAVRACVNPFHLQIVTAQENTAEMLHRRAYLARIAALEAALAEVAPAHPLLLV